MVRAAGREDGPWSEVLAWKSGLTPSSVTGFPGQHRQCSQSPLNSPPIKWCLEPSLFDRLNSPVIISSIKVTNRISGVGGWESWDFPELQTVTMWYILPLLCLDIILSLHFFLKKQMK